MRETIRKILKEQGDELKERFLKSMELLEYMIQSNINDEVIDEIEFFDIETYGTGRYSSIRATAKVRSSCDDPDLNELTKQLKKVESEIYGLFKNFEFSENGKLNKVNGDSYLMVIPNKVDWNGINGDIFMEFDIVQDDYRVDE